MVVSKLLNNQGRLSEDFLDFSDLDFFRTFSSSYPLTSNSTTMNLNFKNNQKCRLRFLHIYHGHLESQ